MAWRVTRMTLLNSASAVWSLDSPCLHYWATYLDLDLDLPWRKYLQMFWKLRIFVKIRGWERGSLGGGWSGGRKKTALHRQTSLCKEMKVTFRQHHLLSLHPSALTKKLWVHLICTLPPWVSETSCRWEAAFWFLLHSVVFLNYLVELHSNSSVFLAY